MQRQPGPARKAVGALAVLAAIVSLLIAGAAAYVFIVEPSFLGLQQPPACPTTTVTTFDSKITTTTIPCSLTSSGNGGPGGGNGASTNSGTTGGTSQTSTSGSTNTSHLETFRVHFNWSGQTTSGNTTDVQKGSGTFLITIDLDLGTGSANGTGHVELDESGLCTAANSSDYTFRVSGTVDPVAGNLTLYGLSPSPSEFSATRSCSAGYSFPPDVLSWPAFYPSQVTLPAMYGASAEGTIGGYIDYEVTLA